VAPSFCLLLIQLIDAFMCVFSWKFSSFFNIVLLNFIAKIVLINLLGGTTITNAGYTVFFGKIYVHFIAFLRMYPLKTPCFIFGHARVVAVSSDFGLHFR